MDLSASVAASSAFISDASPPQSSDARSLAMWASWRTPRTHNFSGMSHGWADYNYDFRKYS